MAHVIQIDTLPFGVTLHRHYDDGYDLEQQCGPKSYYDQVVTQLWYNAVNYYDKADKRNKFLEKVSLHVFGGMIWMPHAGEFGQGSGYAFLSGPTGCTEIHIRYIDPYVNDGMNAYRFPASITHEFGHAYHNWIECFHHAGFKADWERLWRKQFATNGVTDPNQWPWKRDDGVRADHWEGIAGAYRYFKGALCTRGESGTEREPVFAGLEDPAQHPEWNKQLSIMPETCAFMKTYGLMAGTLSWQTGSGGYFQFRRADGVWVAQLDHYSWFEWKYANGTWGWVRYYPSYSRT